MTIKCLDDRSGFAGQTDFDFLGFSTEIRPASGSYRDDARKITVSWFVKLVSLQSRGLARSLSVGLSLQNFFDRHTKTKK